MDKDEFRRKVEELVNKYKGWDGWFSYVKDCEPDSILDRFFTEKKDIEVLVRFGDDETDESFELVWNDGSPYINEY